MVINASTRPGMLVFYDGLNKMRPEGELCSSADDFSESWFLYMTHALKGMFSVLYTFSLLCSALKILVLIPM